MSDLEKDCERIRAHLSQFPNDKRIFLIADDPEIREDIVFCTGGDHLSFITRDWDGISPPGDKEIAVLTDGPMNWIIALMNGMGIPERGSE